MPEGIVGVRILWWGKVEGMKKYKTVKFDLSNDECLWEQFMGFVRLFIPWEEQLGDLTEKQRTPIIAFIYQSEVMGEGHIGFLDMYSKNISFETLKGTLQALDISETYLEVLEKLPQYSLSVDDLVEMSESEEDFELKMDALSDAFEPCDSAFYELGNEEIIDKIIEYVRENYLEFFEFVDDAWFQD